jgi:hypothetical protein
MAALLRKVSALLILLVILPIMPSPTFTRPLGIALGVGLLAACPALAQNQVANYGYGQPGTAGYEHFSFWTNNGRRSNAAYASGKNREDAQLRYLGPRKLAGQPGFRVQFLDGRTLHLVPSGTTLRVADASGAAPKIFTWEYEGPVNGVGTQCSVCVEDEQAALRLIQAHYLK